MCHVLFRGAMFSAAVLVGEAALVATSAAYVPTPTRVAEQEASGETCILINGVWYCFEDLVPGDQDSSRAVPPASIS